MNACVFLLFSCLTFCCLISTKCKPINPTTKRKKLQIPTIETFNFLTRFGYLDEGPADVGAIYNNDAVENAIKILQKFGALPQTGIVDNATLNLMNSPRCGRKDIEKTPNRQKRFVIGAYGWKKRHITYFVANWSPQLSKEGVQKNIQKALDAWGRYGRLQFQEVSNQNADIIVAFAAGNHGDGYSFDGPGNIVAHAFYPYESGYGGDVHFDADESWTLDAEKNEESFDFYNVAVHELGHSLGLGHSPIPSSIMFPYYQGITRELVLDYDDILAMYQLYIQRPIEGNETLSDFGTTTTTTTTTSTTSTTTTERYEETIETTTPSSVYSQKITYEGDFETVDEHMKHDTTHSVPPTVPPLLPNITSSIPDICTENFDTVAVLRKELYFFKGKYLWRLRQKGEILKGYPAPLKQMFPLLPDYVTKIDAAYERDDGMIVLFTDKQFWVFDGYSFIENSPRPLTDLRLPPLLDKVDAVLLWNKNSKVYFFRREMFWRLNGTSNVMDPGYPSHIAERWRGIPEDIDAAIVWNDGHTYFFKGSLYWRFDNIFIEAVEGYPLPTAQIWLRCPEETD